MRRLSILGLAALLLAFAVGCTNKKVNNPLANIGSKQPDKVLFDRSMDAMKHNRFDVARMTLQTLINTYPDSEFIARAKLAVADSWYAEGGSTALQQAEIEYKDFRTFFPNMPEAAEAQLKVGNIHYQQMEKADRDYTHAMRAEQEYRSLIQDYPDNQKVVREAKQRLREVQEVLADREYGIGRFYYLRQSYPAAIARLKTLVDRYPLYSGADEALYLLGQSYEGEIAMVRQNPQVNEVIKSKMIAEFTKSAADAYSRIIRRYPAMDRALDAKARLEALHQTVPRPTRAALDQNKKEVASRHEAGMVASMMGNFSKRPDVGRVTRVGEPTMVDTTPVNAKDVAQEANRALTGGAAPGENRAKIETINGPIGPGQEAPRSDAPPANPQDQAAPARTDQPAPPDQAAQPAPDGNAAAAAGELKPNVADPNELRPNVAADPTALPPPAQTNEITSGPAATDSASSSSKTQSNEELVDISSSKKKKKGLHKLNPF
jgi:outer membrane protein assembly factor BamD